MVLVVLSVGPGSAGMIGEDDFFISTASSRFPDCAYNSVDGKYLVIWSEMVAIKGRFVTVDGSASGSPFGISDAGYSALYPCVVYNAINNEFLVLWDQYQRPGGPWAQRINASTGALIGGNFGVGTAPGDGSRPVAAWNPSRNNYLVAYWSLSETFGQAVSNTGAMIGPTFNISNDGSVFSGFPAISYGSCHDRYLVTWDYSPADHYDAIRGQVINAADFSLYGSQIVVSDRLAECRSAIAYDPNNCRWFVQYQEIADPAYGFDQYGQFISDEGMLIGSPIPIAHTPVFEGETILGRDIAFAPGMGRYFCVYVVPEDAMAGMEMYPDGQPVRPQVIPGVGPGYFIHTNCADTKLNRFLTVWESLIGRDFYIRGQVYQCDTDVTSPTASGAYSVGSVVDVAVTFARKAFVTGAPLLRLETGATDRDAVYVSGGGTNTLTFRYTVVGGDSAADIDYKSSDALVLNGGTIKNEDGVAIDLILAAPGAVQSLGYHKQIVIDTQNATVTNITSTKANGTYRSGAQIYVQVTFNDVVYVTGLPRLELETGPVDRSAPYSSTGSGTNTLTFLYAVQPGDLSPDLDVTGVNALSLNGGTIKDVANNPANLTVPQPGGVGSLGYNKNLVIDAERPTVASVTSLTLDGAYGPGDLINIQVRFSEVVVVTGTPQLELELGMTDRKINYGSGSGSNVLAFPYTVQLGDTSADLNYKTTTSLTQNGGTIKDVAGNFSNLTLPAPGAQRSLGYNKNLVVNSIAAARLWTDGALVNLNSKALYYKKGSVGYVEEPERTRGIRIEGTISVSEGDPVCVGGTMATAAGGERYVLVSTISTCGSAAVGPLGATNRALSDALMEGLYVTAWGKVLAEPVGNTFFISDGSDSVGIKVIVNVTPGVSMGDFVTVRGAAGFDSGRVIYVR